MTRFAYVGTGGLLAALLTLSPCPLVAAPVFGSNLIANGDAEAGSGSANGGVVVVPSWATTGSFTVVQYGASGGFPLSTDPGPASRGANFFAGGPTSATSGAVQLIDVSTVAGTIDAGGVTFDLSGFLGGFSSQRDNAVLTTMFLSGSSAQLGTASLGPVSNVDRGNNTGLLFRDLNGIVPIGTRSINLSLQMTRLDGTYNDGYADNLSLVLATPTGASIPEPSSITLVGIASFALCALGRRGRQIRA